MRIALVNGKGGTGKSTVSLLLAAALIQNDHTAMVDDRDPQQSATALAGNLNVPLTGNADFVLMDTAPTQNHPPTMEAIQSADLVLLISSPSPADLNTTMTTAGEIQRLRKPSAPTRLLFNCVQAGTRLSRQLEDVQEIIPFPSLKHTLARRQAYQLALLHGWSELTGEAREEIKDLLIDIMSVKS